MNALLPLPRAHTPFHHAYCGRTFPTRVPNAKEGRDDPKLDVYGMSGIPAEFADLHNDSAFAAAVAALGTQRHASTALCACVVFLTSPLPCHARHGCRPGAQQAPTHARWQRSGGGNVGANGCDGCADAAAGPAWWAADGVPGHAAATWHAAPGDGRLSRHDAAGHDAARLPASHVRTAQRLALCTGSRRDGGEGQLLSLTAWGCWWSLMWWSGASLGLCTCRT